MGIPIPAISKKLHGKDPSLTAAGYEIWVADFESGRFSGAFGRALDGEARNGSGSERESLLYYIELLEPTSDQRGYIGRLLKRIDPDFPYDTGLSDSGDPVAKLDLLPRSERGFIEEMIENIYERTREE